MKARTIFIGDIQGCYDELILLIDKLKLEEKDIVYIAGDLINKGPKSYKVLNFLHKNQDRFKAILGNHDVEFLNYIDGKYKKVIKGFEKIKRKIEEKNKPELIDYLRSLPLFIEENNFILIHGGLVPGKNIEDHTAEEITNMREYKGNPWYNYYFGEKKIIYGHWAIKGLNIRQNTIGIDTGCCYGNYLTAYILETGEIIQQKALKQYVNPNKNKKISILEKFIKLLKGK